MLICILALSLCFHAISFERSIFTKNAIFTSVALNPLVSLIGRLVAIMYGFTKWLLLEAMHAHTRHTATAYNYSNNTRVCSHAHSTCAGYVL